MKIPNFFGFTLSDWESLAVIFFPLATGIYWLIKRYWATSPVLKVFIREGDIYGLSSDGNERRLTFKASAYELVLARKKRLVVFLQGEAVEMKRPYTRFKLISIDTKTLEEKVLWDQKFERDGLAHSFEIEQPRQLTLSGDHSKVLLIIEKYVTGSQLVQVDIKSGRVDELFSAEHFEIIKSGRYSGKFLVEVSAVEEKGRDMYYRMTDKKGKTLIKFPDYDSYKSFRGRVLNS